MVYNALIVVVDAALQVSDIPGKVSPPSITPGFFHSLGDPLTSTRVAALFVASDRYELTLEPSALCAYSRAIPTRWTRKNYGALMELPRVRSDLLRIWVICSWKSSVTNCCNMGDTNRNFDKPHVEVFCIRTLRRTTSGGNGKI